MWPLEHLASTSTNQQIPEHRDRAQWPLQSGDLSLLIFGMLLYFQASAAPSLFLLLSLSLPQYSVGVDGEVQRQGREFIHQLLYCCLCSIRNSGFFSFRMKEKAADVRPQDPI